LTPVKSSFGPKIEKMRKDANMPAKIIKGSRGRWTLVVSFHNGSFVDFSVPTVGKLNLTCDIILKTLGGFDEQS